MQRITAQTARENQKKKKKRESAGEKEWENTFLWTLGQALATLLLYLYINKFCSYTRATTNKKWATKTKTQN